MKTKKFRACLILLGLTLINIQAVKAETIGKLKKFAGDQLTNFNLNGLLVIGGIVGASLIIYFISNYLIKEKEEPITAQNRQISRHHHRHHHVKNIIKKTA